MKECEKGETLECQIRLCGCGGWGCEECRIDRIVDQTVLKIMGCFAKHQTDEGVDDERM